MEPIKETKVIGKLLMTIYTFAKAGDELPLHTHTKNDCHITIINRGSIRAFGPGLSWEKVLKPGDIVAFKPNDPHAFEALEDDTKIYNIIY